jgi:hypothetical protein
VSPSHLRRSHMEPEPPYGADGDHIAFLDGHVEWFNNISGELTNPITKKSANSILQSISQGAQFFGDPDKSLLNGKEGVSGN